MSSFERAVPKRHRPSSATIKAVPGPHFPCPPRIPIIFVTLLAVLGAGCRALGSSEPTPALEIPASFMGVRAEPPTPKPDFVLTDADGKPFDIRAETEGYVTLLNVGYTHCPDVCPTHLNKLARVLKNLHPDVAARVKVLFITADPERDTPDLLKTYLGIFDESFIGLTGDRESIDAVQHALGMPTPTREDLGGGAYAVNHIAYVLAFGADNFAHVVFSNGTGIRAIINDVTKLAREGWSQSSG